MIRALKFDILALVIILCAALGTRVVFLGSTGQVVFDEVHFGKFISAYCCTHERFFDIHPPIGKLIIAGGAHLVGYNGMFPFENIGQSYSNIPIEAIRLVPALFGSLLPLIIFIILRQIGVSPLFSFVGGMAIALDNALIVESRFILTDSILFSATFGALAFVLASMQAKHKLISWMWILCAAVSSGIAVGTKFTGMIALGLVIVFLLYQAYVSGIRYYRAFFVKIVLVTAVAIAVYLFGWWLHFALLTLPGSGDAWGLPTGNFIQDLIKTHQQMISANYNLTAGHPYGSKWWTWPFMIRSVFYWQGGSSQFIYLLGNPVVWWGSFALLCTALTESIGSFIIRRNRTKVVIGSSIWLIVLGYFWAYVPLMRVPRVLFLYHYITPLIFSLLLAVWWIDRTVHYKKEVAVGTLLLVCVGFFFISPLTYGFSISGWLQSILFSISSWR